MAKLNGRQRDTLNDYLLQKKDLIESTNPSTSDVCSWCREVLKFDVDIGNLTSRVGPQGVLYKHEWPGSEGVRKSRLGERYLRTVVVAQIERMRLEFLRFTNEVGKTGFGGRVAEWESVVNQSRLDLADTDFREDEEK